MRIVIADTHDLIREALVFRLSAEDEIEVPGEAESQENMVTLVAETRPEILLADIDLVDPTASDIFNVLRTASPDTRICVWSSTPTPAIAFTMLGWGASGFLPKQSSSERVICALRSIALGYAVVPSRYLGDFTALRRNVTRSGNIFGLSGREIEVLEACAEGLTTREIAERLNISARTVETHRGAIYRKTDCRCMADIGGLLQSPEFHNMMNDGEPAMPQPYREAMLTN